MRNDKSFAHNEIRDVLNLPFILTGRHGLLRAVGPDGLDLLNRLSSNRVIGKLPGDVIETILTTEKGRIIDVLLVLVRDDDVLMVTTKGKTGDVLEWLEKYTIMEDVRYEDVSEVYSVDRIAGELPKPFVPEEIWKWHRTGERPEDPIVASHNSIRGAGYAVITRAEHAVSFRNAMKEEESYNLVEADEKSYNIWRVAHGCPEVGYELTEMVNPLESGAAAAVDFEKGCYIGQEVIARLDSYDKVQRQLKSVEFTNPGRVKAETGDGITADGKRAGFITTVEYDSVRNRSIGLACIRHAFAEQGRELQLQIDDSVHTLRVI